LVTALVALAGGAFAGCAKAPEAPPMRPQRGPSEVTILFTTDEHGWLFEHADHGRTMGGAAEMLGLWKAAEGHCPGPAVGEDRPPPCADAGDPGTLALSGGDNYTGPAVSTYFDGEPTAEALRRMGYAASAFGNHEFDFGREAFLANRAKSGMTYLAANLRAPPARQDMALPAHAMFTRRGVKIGVVGLATDTTLRAAMARRFEGITFEDEEPALDRGVRGAWAAGADAVVVIAHECADKLAPIVERHPEWRLSFVGAGHCHKVISVRAGDVPVIAPGWRLDHYARVRMQVDAGRPAGQRILAVDAAVVSLSRPEGAPSSTPPDAPLARAAAVWKGKVDAALGEQIGWSEAGIERDAPEMGRWIAGALRAEAGAEIAVVNQSGLRQNLPRGPITKASVWSILPFDNRVVVLRIDGEGLAANLRNKEAVTAGIRRGEGGFFLDGGRLLPLGEVRTVATLDFLFFGGDRFTFAERALSSEERADWRDLVIAWTKKQRTAPGAPLEARLAP
jgi:2',3'-cyclic-nucleotide 2'-phosphodiesterase (5'-nucleotidase family)